MPSLKLPFIVTVGVSTAACGGAAVVDPSSSSSGAGTGGSGAGGFGGNTSACPAEPPGDGYGQCAISQGETCTYEIDCQSGPVSLTFACDGVWRLPSQSCDMPYDSCPGTHYHCDGEWWMPTATNPPSPCPPELPEEGTACYAGGMGGVWEDCGYAERDCWFVATCVQDPSGAGQWEHTDTCLPI